VSAFAFSGVWKVLGLLLVLADTTGTSEDFFSTKRGISLFAYNQGLRGGDKRGKSFRATLAAGAPEDENTHAKFFCNQAQNLLCKPVAN